MVLVGVTLAPAAANAAPPATWSPPASLVQPLDEVRRHQEQTYNNGNLYEFRNYGWDQVMANRGYIAYCARWDSSATVSTAQRDQVHAALARQHKKWAAARAATGVSGSAASTSWPT